MEERIYTIPINESFDKFEGCPMCRLHDDLEAKSLDYILGGAMMEPNVRISTNEQGFCEDHLDKLAKMKNRLSVALILDTHVNEIIKNISEKPANKAKKSDIKKLISYFEELNSSCFVCKRVSGYMKAITKNIIFLYKTEEEFQQKFAAQPYFCTHHTEVLLKRAVSSLNKKTLKLFVCDLLKTETNKLQELAGDLNWFCKKFDYRYENEDWKNSKDAIERTQKILR